MAVPEDLITWQTNLSNARGFVAAAVEFRKYTVNQDAHSGNNRGHILSCIEAAYQTVRREHGTSLAVRAESDEEDPELVEWYRVLVATVAQHQARYHEHNLQRRLRQAVVHSLVPAYRSTVYDESHEVAEYMDGSFWLPAMRAYIDSHVQLHAVGDTRENEVLRSQRHLNTLDAYLAVNGMGDADGQADDVPFDSYAGFARQIQQSLVEMVHDSDDLAVHLEGLSTAVLDTGEDVLTFFASFADSIVDMLDHNVI